MHHYLALITTHKGKTGVLKNMFVKQYFLENNFKDLDTSTNPVTVT